MRLDFLDAARCLLKTGRLDDDLSRVWPAFVNCARRMETLAPFLDAHIPPHRNLRVLDTAAGIGCEAAHFATTGNRVVANEISPSLREILCEALEDASVDVTSHDWRDLSRAFGRAQFDAAILLGNSICLLLPAPERRLALRRLGETLKPGARLLIDQRNFALLIQRRAEVLSGAFEFRSEVMYCGTGIIGYPISVGVREVVFAYLNPQSGAVAGFLRMSTFSESPLIDELQHAGFVDIESYYDLGRANEGDADFITYSCVKA